MANVCSVRSGLRETPGHLGFIPFEFAQQRPSVPEGASHQSLVGIALTEQSKNDVGRMAQMV